MGRPLPEQVQSVKRIIFNQRFSRALKWKQNQAVEILMTNIKDNWKQRSFRNPYPNFLIDDGDVRTLDV